MKEGKSYKIITVPKYLKVESMNENEKKGRPTGWIVDSGVLKELPIFNG